MSDNKDVITTVTESEPVATPAETTEKVLQRVPEEWIRIDNTLDILTSFNSVINADCLKGVISDIMYSLVRKNALYYLTNWDTTFEIDWDDPVTYGEDDLTLYPARSVFFPDVKSIYDLAYSVYGTNGKIYTYDSETNSFYSYDRLRQTSVCLAVFSLKLTILCQKSGTSSIFQQALILNYTINKVFCRL